MTNTPNTTADSDWKLDTPGGIDPAFGEAKPLFNLASRKEEAEKAVEGYKNLIRSYEETISRTRAWKATAQAGLAEAERFLKALTPRTRKPKS